MTNSETKALLRSILRRGIVLALRVSACIVVPVLIGAVARTFVRLISLGWRLG